METPNSPLGILASDTLDARQRQLAESIIAEHYSAYPHLSQQHGETGRQKCLQDVMHHLSYLSNALATHQPALFAAYLAWVKILLIGLNLQWEDLRVSLEITRAVLAANMPADQAALACHFVDIGLAHLSQAPMDTPSFLEDAQPHASLAQEYIRLLLASEHRRASDLILDAVKHNQISAPDVYLHIFQRSQREIGRLWQLHSVSIAQEHYCTAVTRYIMAQLYPNILSQPRNGRRLLATCVGGELHEIGLRMVADFMEMDGWSTYFLGASVPLAGIQQAITQFRPHLLCVSATMTFHVRQVQTLIAAIRQDTAAQRLHIMVGGYPFNLTPDLWRAVGADSFAPDAAQAAEIAAQLL